jgi:hypothetical protein
MRGVIGRRHSLHRPLVLFDDLWVDHLALQLSSGLGLKFLVPLLDCSLGCFAIRQRKSSLTKLSMVVRQTSIVPGCLLRYLFFIHRKSGLQTWGK